MDLDQINPQEYGYTQQDTIAVPAELFQNRRDVLDFFLT